MNGSHALSTEVVRACPLCGSADKEVLFTGLRDRFFGVPGEWTYKRCRRCTLVFLDPRPTREDIGKAYAVYSTHALVALPDNLPRRLRSYVRGGYLANKFGYGTGVDRLQRLAGWLAYLHPGQREYMNGSIMYLPASRRGRVLDVGCGAGEALDELRRLGWEVEGVDPDPEAVANAVRNRGLKVRVGTLEDQSYPRDHFDAVVLSHTIEHVHDPVSLLRECRRVMRPGGLLVVATPNTESMGSGHFGPDWRVLEPPRHLMLFSRKTLSQAARAAGLSLLELRTTVRGADGVFTESRELRAVRSAGESLIKQKPAPVLERLKGHAYQYVVSIALWAIPNAGEELLMVATK
jgi:2-polyprenyl-3-methyl-5-hydroxy-6-metoxy-1,4-benzoquinol methylase